MFAELTLRNNMEIKYQDNWNNSELYLISEIFSNLEPEAREWMTIAGVVCCVQNKPLSGFYPAIMFSSDGAADVWLSEKAMARRVNISLIVEGLRD